MIFPVCPLVPIRLPEASHWTGELPARGRSISRNHSKLKFSRAVSNHMNDLSKIGSSYASNSYPKVAVPIIDRLLDEDSEGLWRLSYSLVWHGFPHRETFRPKLEQIF